MSPYANSLGQSSTGVSYETNVDGAGIQRVLNFPSLIKNWAKLISANKSIV